MRSADIVWRGLVCFGLCAGMLGCASVGDPLKAAAQRVMAPVAGAAASAPSAMAAAGSAVGAGVAKLEPEAPVNPDVQRSYDDALRTLRAGRVADAERSLQQLAKANPELGGPHANLGLIYRQSGKLPEAVLELEQAVRVNPKQPLYFNQLGLAYREHGQFAKAREAYEQAIALDPNYAAAQLNLGILLDLYLSDGPRALQQYDRYLALSPGGDATVSKWIADLKNRKPAPITVSKKEKP
jgi:Flp pilus assembly protein TadD